MKKLSSFTFITLNGFTEGPKQGQIDWHLHGKEENEFAAESMEDGNTLIFGRKTYELMASYWRTPMAMQNDPEVSAGMNEADKIVFSRTMKTVEWNKTRLINGNLIEEIQSLKKGKGPGLTLLGSGSVLIQLADAGLVDEFAFMLDPVAIGSGTSLFDGLKTILNLKLIRVRTFSSGTVLLQYVPN